MARKSKGRGTAAAFGLVLLFAGLVGGGVLYMLSDRRPSEAVDGFARSPVGCTTTLRFTETGTFYVFEELGPVNNLPDGGCEPASDPALTFSFDLEGPDGPVVQRRPAAISYDTDDYLGESVAAIEVEVVGEYEIVVVGNDPAVAAAIGRDPDDGVDELRERAIIVVIVGVVLGALLLLLAGRRSKRAAAFLTPDGPGWAPTQSAEPIITGGEPLAVRSAVNPHQPDEQVSIAGPLSEVNDLLSRPRPPKLVSPWAPPVAGQVVPEPTQVEQPQVEQPQVEQPQVEQPQVEQPQVEREDPPTPDPVEPVVDAAIDAVAADPEQPAG